MVAVTKKPRNINALEVDPWGFRSGQMWMRDLGIITSWTARR